MMPQKSTKWQKLSLVIQGGKNQKIVYLSNNITSNLNVLESSIRCLQYLSTMPVRKSL